MPFVTLPLSSPIPSHIIKQNKKLIMKNRRLLDEVLPKLLVSCLLILPDKIVERLVFSDTYLEVFSEVGRIADNDQENVSQDIAAIIGLIMDIYDRCPWNPNKNLPLETASQVIDWFVIFVSSSLEKNNLFWNGKVGKRVIQLFKNI